MAVARPVLCPRCKRTVSLRLAWDLTPKNKRGFLDYSAGVVCPGCKVRLRIVESRAKSIALYLGLSGIVLCAISAPWFNTITGALFFGVGAIAIGLALFPSGFAKNYLSVEVRTGTDVVDFPVERLKQDLEVATGTRNDHNEANLLAAKEYWVCSQCGEPNPTGSGLCFSCGNHNAAAI
jgi:hypothetical protein